MKEIDNQYLGVCHYERYERNDILMIVSIDNLPAEL